MNNNKIRLATYILLNSLCSSSQAVNKQQVVLDATVVQPTCTVTIGDGVLADNKVDFGTLAANGVEQNPSGSYAKHFKLKIGDCQTPAGLAGLTPKLTISGTTLSADGQHKLFNNTASAAAGFIVQMHSENTVTWANANAKDTEVNLAAASTAAPSEVTIQVGVSKGELASAAVTGALAAAVTFTFRYG